MRTDSQPASGLHGPENDPKPAESFVRATERFGLLAALASLATGVALLAMATTRTVDDWMFVGIGVGAAFGFACDRRLRRRLAQDLDFPDGLVADLPPSASIA